MPEVKLTDWQIKNLAIPLVSKVAEQVQEFYAKPDNEKRFKEWYEATYDKPVPKGV